MYLITEIFEFLKPADVVDSDTWWSLILTLVSSGISVLSSCDPFCETCCNLNLNWPGPGLCDPLF